MVNHIPKEEWADFFDGFAKTHEDYEARLEIIGRLFGDQEEAAWLPLAGISYDPHHEQLAVTIGGLSGRYPAHLTHTIDRPRMVHVGYVPDGEVRSLLIVAPDKTETLVRLRPRPQQTA
jgi:hypothetical protein